MPLGSGKRASLVANLFVDKSSNPSKVPQVECLFCKKCFSKNRTRIDHHIRNCGKCPEATKEKYLSKLKKQSKQSLRTPLKSTLSPLQYKDSLGRTSTPISSTPKRSSQSNMKESFTITPASDKEDFEEVHLQKSKYRPMQKKEMNQSSKAKFMDNVKPAEQASLEQHLARAIFTSGCPFSIVDNPYWIKFFNTIRPSFVVPSRYELSNRLLNNEYLQVKTYIAKLVAETQSLGIMCEGWCNIRKESIINFVITVPEPIFWKYIPTGKDSSSREYIAKKISIVIEEVGAMKVLGVVTDNASNMKAAWNILEIKFPHIHFYGCIAHGLKLLFLDYSNIETMRNFLNEAVIIVKEITRKHKSAAIFKETQDSIQQGQQQNETRSLVSLKLPVKTRCGSVVTCLESLQLNKKVLKTMAIAEDSNAVLTSEAIQSILSDIFWNRVNGFLNLLKPIALAIKTLEVDNPMISEVAEIFRKLEENMKQNLPISPFSKAEEKTVIEKFYARKIFCVKNIHFAANLLHPKFKGRTLSDEESIDACGVIYNIAKSMEDVDETEVLRQLASFRNGVDIFSKQFLIETAKTLTPIVWWTAICSSMAISKVAIRILNLPPTSAACKRTFSTYANVLTAKRNGLSNESAAKLVFVSQNLQIFQNSQKSVSFNDTSTPTPNTSFLQEEVVLIEDDESDQCQSSDNENDENVFKGFITDESLKNSILFSEIDSD